MNIYVDIDNTICNSSWRTLKQLNNSWSIENINKDLPILNSGISGEIKKIETLCRIDTKNELEYYKNGGILQYVLRNMI